MKKLSFFTAALATFTLGAPLTYAANVDDVTDGSPYYYQATPGTDVTPGVGGPQGDTDSGIDHLPVFHGHMMTNDTYRFVNIAEQVFTMIGDGKTGLWRYQDNGTVREYITPDAAGVPVPADDPGTVLDESDLSHPDAMSAFVAGLTAVDIGIDYSHFFATGLPFAGYKSNADIGAAGTPAPFLDIPIFHERYEGKYDAHGPIDLAGYNSRISADDFIKARAAMDFAFAQPGAGHDNIGPLGVRAGLDITENYVQVLRLELLPDARIWANTESADEAHWQEIDTNKTLSEIYLVERPFFNEGFLFIVAIFDNNNDFKKKSQHSYIRPYGAYFDHLVGRGLGNTFSTTLKTRPEFDVFRINNSGNRANGGKQTLRGTRLYGVHHPGVDINPNVAIVNGACPNMGGDFGESYYGSAWPNNYQEITPLCDGVLIDIKLFANLDGANWDDENKNLANNTGSTGLDPFNPLLKHYSNFTTAPAANPGTYGVFTDPYLNANGIINPEVFTVDGTDELTFPSSNDQVLVVQ